MTRIMGLLATMGWRRTRRIVGALSAAVLMTGTGWTVSAQQRTLSLYAPVPVEKPRAADMVRLRAPTPAIKPAAATPAKRHFGAVDAPDRAAPEVIGFYSKGCLSGGSELAIDGPYHQVMRLSRNRRYGHPSLIRFIQDLAARASDRGWPGLLVGDLAQPRGGPMLTGHASHQSGLDADIWLRPAPPRPFSLEERETESSWVLSTDNRTIEESFWRNTHLTLIRTAAEFPEVARIFVNPAIKKRLCDDTQYDPPEQRSWLRKVRPWFGHNAHMHVRLVCPPGSENCRDQSPPAKGHGCDADLDYWFTAAPWAKPDVVTYRAPLTLRDLPAACVSLVSR